jgi:glutamate-1-semialdehyde aminotransferase
MTTGHTQIVKTTGNFHGAVRKPLFGVAEGLLDDATAFHPGNDMLDANATAGNNAIEKDILDCQLATSRLFLADE